MILNEIEDLENKIKKCESFYMTNRSSFGWSRSLAKKLNTIQKDLERQLRIKKEELKETNRLTTVKVLIEYSN